MQLEWSYDALDDLDGIWEYIAKDNPDRASSFIDEIRKEVQKLLLNPYLGRVIPELDDVHLRELIYRNYTIIYEISVETIIIHEIHNQYKFFIRSIPRG